jgi:hypothetical protein
MVCSNYRGISLLSTSYKILTNILLSRLIPYVDEIIGDHQCDFDVINQLLIKYFAFVRYWRKNGNTMRLYISYLYISGKPMIQLEGKYYTTFSLNLVYQGN